MTPHDPLREEDDPPLHPIGEAVTLEPPPLPPDPLVPAEFIDTALGAPVPTPPPSSRSTTDPAPAITAVQGEEILGLLRELKAGVARADTQSKSAADAVVALGSQVNTDLDTLRQSFDAKLDASVSAIGNMLDQKFSGLLSDLDRLTDKRDTKLKGELDAVAKVSAQANETAEKALGESVQAYNLAKVAAGESPDSNGSAEDRLTVVDG